MIFERPVETVVDDLVVVAQPACVRGFDQVEHLVIGFRLAKLASLQYRTDSVARYSI